MRKQPPSSHPLATLLARWIDQRRKLSPGARAPIFCTLAGGRVDASYVRHLLPRLAAKAGLDRRVHAHGLRHTYASELAREGTAINVIRDALGHTSLAVTDRYLRDVAPVMVVSPRALDRLTARLSGAGSPRAARIGRIGSSRVRQLVGVS